MHGVFDKVKQVASDWMSKVNTGNQETEGLGNELRAKVAQGTEPKKPVAAPVKAEPAPWEKVGHKPYGSGPGEKKIDTSKMTTPVYDKGGKVLRQQQDQNLMNAAAATSPVLDKGGKVNVNDGKHVLAILKEGERVLTPEENKDWEKEHGTRKDKNMKDCYDEGGAVHTPEEKAHFARSMHKLHGGALHRHFGIPEDQPIPMAKKQEAANSENPHVAAMGRLAVSMSGWKHGKK